MECLGATAQLCKQNVLPKTWNLMFFSKKYKGVEVSCIRNFVFADETGTRIFKN